MLVKGAPDYSDDARITIWLAEDDEPKHWTLLLRGPQHAHHTHSAPRAFGIPKSWWVMGHFILSLVLQNLTHWGRVTHIWVGNLTTIGSDNGLSPVRCQAIIWTNAGILLNGPLWTNFIEILIEIPTFPFKKMCLKVSSAKWRPFCLGLNVLSNPRWWSLNALNKKHIIYQILLRSHSRSFMYIMNV